MPLVCNSGASCTVVGCGETLLRSLGMTRASPVYALVIHFKTCLVTVSMRICLHLHVTFVLISYSSVLSGAGFPTPSTADLILVRT